MQQHAPMLSTNIQHAQKAKRFLNNCTRKWRDQELMTQFIVAFINFFIQSYENLSLFSENYHLRVLDIPDSFSIIGETSSVSLFLQSH